jgi:hypothetical protein
MPEKIVRLILKRFGQEKGKGKTIIWLSLPEKKRGEKASVPEKPGPGQDSFYPFKYLLKNARQRAQASLAASAR